MSDDARLREVQRRQRGLITRDQVTELGMHRKVIDRRVRAGAWARVHPGVYRDTLLALSLRQSCPARLRSDLVVVHRGLTTPMSIRRCLHAFGGKGRPGTKRLREILDDRASQRPPCRASR
jgi:hypothetical protein